MFPFVQNHDVVPIVMIVCVTLQKKKKRKKKEKPETTKGHYIKDSHQSKPVRKWGSDTFKGEMKYDAVQDACNCCICEWNLKCDHSNERY